MISLILFLYKNGDLGITLCLRAQPVLRSKDQFWEGVIFLFRFLYKIVDLCLEIAKMQKKRNPKLIIELWYKNVALKFIDMKISRENFQDKAHEFVNIIQGDQYFSDSVKVSTHNLY